MTADIRRLHDLDVVVVERRQAGARQAVGDAALLVAAVEPRRVDGRSPRLGCRARRALPSAVSAGMRPSGGSTMSDVRRPSVSVAARIGPVLRVREAGANLLGRAVHAAAGARLERLHLFFGVELARAELARPLERRDGAVVPGALQVGMSPRRARRRSRLWAPAARSRGRLARRPIAAPHTAETARVRAHKARWRIHSLPKGLAEAQLSAPASPHQDRPPSRRLGYPGSFQLRAPPSYQFGAFRTSGVM